MKAILMFLILFGFLLSASDEVRYDRVTKEHGVYHDGVKEGTIKENKLTNRYDIYDEYGRKTGEIRQGFLKNEWRIRIDHQEGDEQ